MFYHIQLEDITFLVIILSSQEVNKKTTGRKKKTQEKKSQPLGRPTVNMGKVATKKTKTKKRSQANKTCVCNYV